MLSRHLLSGLRGRALFVATLSLLAFGCASTSSTSGSTTVVDEASERESRIAQAESRRRERDEIRERESLRALEQARVPTPPTETVRIGDERAARDADRWGSDHTWQTPEAVTNNSAPAPRENANRSGRRPVLRLYGTPQPEPVPEGFTQGFAGYPPAGYPPGYAPPLQMAPLPPRPVAGSTDPMTSYAATSPAVPAELAANRPPVYGASATPPSFAPAVHPGAQPAQPNTDRAVIAYRGALANVRDQRFDEALTAFAAFTENHPRHPYVANAFYWMGEVQYIKRAYQDAMEHFGTVLRRFPDGGKAPDAMLKLGMCHMRLGDLPRANDFFRRLRSEHPNSVAARMAPREDAS